MRLNILIGGKAGQGINRISKILSRILIKQGYFVFNYRDYPSLIRGGHNFSIMAISDKKVGSIEKKIDGIVAFNSDTVEIHKNQLKKDGFIIEAEKFDKEKLGINLNVALAGTLVKILGLDEKALIDEIKEQLDDEHSISIAKQSYANEKTRFKLEKINRKINIMSGSEAVAQGAMNSEIDIYFAYPMTPATTVMHELAVHGKVFQAEDEIAVINASIGASFAGARAMTGTAGGGFDLMTEAISFAGQAEIPLVIYLASRPGPGTGVPTYTSQSDLNIAIKSGHGEFSRVVIAPGDPIEAVEKTNEAFYLAEKFNTISIILSDKHLAESEFSSDRKPNKIIPLSKRKPLIKANSYEHDISGNTSEDAILVKKNAEKRITTYDEIKKTCKEFEMIKIYGNPNSKNLIIGWGSTKTAILDAIEGLDFKFIHVIYLKPMSEEIKKEIQKAKKVILVENNSTGQLGRLIREKTGIKIENRIFKYDGRPFESDQLKEDILKIK